MIERQTRSKIEPSTMTGVMLRKRKYSLQVRKPLYSGSEPCGYGSCPVYFGPQPYDRRGLLYNSTSCLLLQKRVIFCSYSCISWFTLPLFREKWIKTVMNKSNFKITLLIITAAACEILSEVRQSNARSAIQNKRYAARHSHFEKAMWSLQKVVF